MGETNYKTGYIPVLDGLRALSILLVLLSHSTIYDQPTPWLLEMGIHCGETGVAVFFVISGYLITSLLLKEEKKNGRISLSGFYTRRVLRIFPAYYFYLLVIGTLSFSGTIPRLPVPDYVASFIFVRNLVGHAHETAHLWSLALEEQFYFLWPSILVFVRPPQRLRITIGIIIAISVWRSTLVALSAVDVGALYMRTDLRFDSLLVGCVLALLRADNGFRERIAQFQHWPGASVCGPALLAGWVTYIHRLPGGGALATLGTALLIAFVVNWLLENPTSIIDRLLSVPVLLFIGRLSFSLYLWQQLYLGPALKIGTIRSFPFSLVAAIASAGFSYFLVERPFLALKRRWYGSTVPATIKVGPTPFDAANQHV